MKIGYFLWEAVTLTVVISGVHVVFLFPAGCVDSSGFSCFGDFFATLP